MEVIPFEDDQNMLEDALNQAIEKVDTGSGVVCFADLAGGTPFNVSARIAASAENENIQVIGGANLPMLLSGIFQRELSIEQFVETVIKEGKENIHRFEVKPKKVEQNQEGI